ncbi:LysM peptidoglycan-binding domain-containing protein [Roseateles toxinivorans]|uniref:YD repeat-containing protein n=1 Tax=Roseateles toxinivorans TaxID=270368 RepID=A0A4R6QNA1_9BURK|nr:LysM peptidoglycan-binding domain-containing protein [Roseateles toxinivorans]TDP71061.1 YD repeat-containing protein [Roseateles toxinivorans]
MVAIVSGNSLGLGLSSWATLGQRGVFGDASLGRTGGNGYVNVATGNLVLQGQDEGLMGRGLDVAALRTYNSQGRLNDDNGDNWSVGIYRQQIKCNDAPELAATTLTRTGRDGAEEVYSWNAAGARYVSSNGFGAYDTIRPEGIEYVWTDGDTSEKERYDITSGRLSSHTDAQGNTVVFTYHGDGNIASMKTANGETLFYDYSGNKLTQLRTVTADAITTTRVRYGYDGSNRLSTVSVDLTPADGSVADGKTYTTTYTYDGASKRVASVAGNYGSYSLNFSYVQVGAEWRVESVMDGLNPATKFAYDPANRRTTVTNPLGHATVYEYDAAGQLTQVTTPAVAGVAAVTRYQYNASGDLESIIDGEGRALTMRYDLSGNQILQRDAAGNTIERTFNANNQLLTETRYLVPDPDGSGSALPREPVTERYVYDLANKNRLRFVISAEGRVTEHQYNSFGERGSTIQYVAARYNLSGLPVSGVPTDTTVAIWAAAQPQGQITRTDMSYDARGQLKKSVSFANVDASTGAGLWDSRQSVKDYIYVPAGLLLTTIEGNGTANDSVTSYTYDGMGRVLTVTDALLQTTITAYQDDASGSKVNTTFANGLTTSRYYDRVGQLAWVWQSGSAGAVDLGTTHYFYDLNGRLAMTEDPSGQRAWLMYDEAGRQIAAVDSNGSVTEYRYNNSNEVVRTTKYKTPLDRAVLDVLYKNQITGWRNPAGITPIFGTNADDVIVTGAGILNVIIGSSGRDSYIVSVDHGRADTLYFFSPGEDYIDIGGLLQSIGYLGSDPFADGIVRLVHTPPTYQLVLDKDGAGPGAARVFMNIRGAEPLQAGQVVPGRDIRWSGIIPKSLKFNELGLVRDPQADVDTWNFYDAAGRLFKTVDALGYVTEAKYDGASRVLSTVRYAKAADMARFKANPVVANAVPSGLNPLADRVTRNIYDADGLLRGSLDGEGFLVEYLYDSAGRLVKKLAYESSVDAALRATGDLDAMRPRPTLRVYYQPGNNSSAVRSLGSFQAGDVVTATVRFKSDSLTSGRVFLGDSGGPDPYDNAVYSAVTYGNDGWKTITVSLTLSHDDQLWLFIYGDRDGAYRKMGNFVDYDGMVVSSVKRPEVLRFDGSLSGWSFNQAKITGASATHYLLNGLGQVAGEVDAEGYLTERVYDAGGHLVREIRYATALTAAASASVTSSSPIQSLRPGSTARDRSQSWHHDALGRLDSETNAEGTVTTYEYNSAGQLIKTNRAFGRPEVRTLNVRYDLLGRLTGELSAKGGALLTGSQTSEQVEAIWAQYGTHYSYDLVGNRTSMVAPGSHARTLYFYNEDRQLTHTVNALGEVEERQYDGLNQLVRTIRYGGRIAAGTLGQLSGGLVTTAITGAVQDLLAQKQEGSDEVFANAVTDFYRNVRGDLIIEAGPQGSASFNTYNAFGEVWINARMQTSSVFEASMFEYDRRGLQVKVTQQGGAGSPVMTYRYDAFGRLESSIDANGIGQRWSHDRLGRVVEHRDGLTTLRRTGYDAFARVLTQVDAYNRTTTYGYNDATRSVSVLTAAGVTTTTTRNRFGETESVLDGTSKLTRYDYNRDGKLTAVSGEDLSTGSHYDELQRLIESTDANGIKTRYEYDEINRVKSSTLDPSGLNRKTSFDYLNTEFGSSVITTDSTGIKSRDDFDLKGQLLRHIDDADGLKLVTGYSYDFAGHQLTVTNAKKVKTSYTYDTLGRRISEVADDGGLSLKRSYRYDLKGNLIAVIQGNGDPSFDRVTVHAYDALGRQTLSMDALGGIVEQVYDLEGNVVKRMAYAAVSAEAAKLAAARTNPSDATLRAALVATPGQDRVELAVFDADGRKNYAIDAEGGVTRLKYDGNGNVIERLQYARALTSAQVAALPTPATTASLSVVAAGPMDRRTSYRYDSANRLRFEVDALGYVTETRYNGLETTSIRYKNPVAVPSATPAPTPGEDLVTTQILDAAGRAWRSIDAMGVETQNHYDDVARTLDQTHAYGLPEASTTRYSYDAVGRVQSKTVAYGTLAAATTIYEYNALGQLTREIEARGVALAQGNSDWARGERLKLGLPEDAAGLTQQQKLDLQAAYATKHEYDNLGRRTQTTNALGATTLTRYDTFGNAVKVTDPRGNTGYFYFDKLNRVTVQVDPEGFATQTAYWNAASNQIGSVRRFCIKVPSNTTEALPPVLTPHARDALTINLYDRLDRLVSSTDAASASERIEFGVDGNRFDKRVTNKLGGVATYRYDTLGRQVTETLPVAVSGAAVVNVYTYDAFGNRILTIEAQGLAEQRTTSYRHDKAGRVTHRIGTPYTSIDVPAGATSDVTPLEFTRYDALGRVIESISGAILVDSAVAGGARTLSYFDAAGNKLAQIAADGAMISYSHDPAGQVILESAWATRIVPMPAAGTTPAAPASSPAIDRITQMDYDRLGRLLSKTRLAVIWWESAPNADKVELLSVSPRPVVLQQLHYDAAGNLIEEIDGRGNSVFNYYDKLGRKILRIDQEGYAIGWDYDSFHAAVSTEIKYAQKVAQPYTRQDDPDGGTARTLRQVLSVAGARTTQYQLDKLGRVELKTVKDVQTQYVEASGFVSSRTLDATTSYVYDGLGNITYIRERVGLDTAAKEIYNETDVEYDKLGRETRRRDAGFTAVDGAWVRPEVLTEYTGLGAVAKVVRLGGIAAQDRITRYDYNANGDRVGQVDAGDNITVFILDKSGRVGRTIAWGVKDADGQSVTAETLYRYDEAGRVTWQQDVATSEIRQTRYNSFGEVSGKGLGDGWQEFAEYNTLGKVLRNNSGDGTSKIYLYDRNGNTTREIKGSTQNLQAMSISDAAQSTELNQTFSAYDRRNLLVKTVEIDIRYLQAFDSMRTAFERKLAELTGAFRVESENAGQYGGATGGYAGSGASTSVIGNGDDTKFKADSLPSMGSVTISATPRTAVSVPGLNVGATRMFTLLPTQRQSVRSPGQPGAVKRVLELPESFLPGKYQVIRAGGDPAEIPILTKDRALLQFVVPVPMTLGDVSTHYKIRWSPPTTSAGVDEWVDVAEAYIKIDTWEPNTNGTHDISTSGSISGVRGLLVQGDDSATSSFRVLTVLDGIETPVAVSATKVAKGFWRLDVSSLPAGETRVAVKSYDQSGRLLAGSTAMVTTSVDGEQVSSLGAINTAEASVTGTDKDFVIRLAPSLLDAGSTYTLHMRLMGAGSWTSIAITPAGTARVQGQTMNGGAPWEFLIAPDRAGARYYGTMTGRTGQAPALDSQMLSQVTSLGQPDLSFGIGSLPPLPPGQSYYFGGLVLEDESGGLKHTYEGRNVITWNELVANHAVTALQSKNLKYSYKIYIESGGARRQVGQATGGVTVGASFSATPPRNDDYAPYVKLASAVPLTGDITLTPVGGGATVTLSNGDIRRWTNPARSGVLFVDVSQWVPARPLGPVQLTVACTTPGSRFSGTITIQSDGRVQVSMTSTSDTPGTVQLTIPNALALTVLRYVKKGDDPKADGVPNRASYTTQNGPPTWGWAVTPADAGDWDFYYEAIGWDTQSVSVGHGTYKVGADGKVTFSLLVADPKPPQLEFAPPSGTERLMVQIRSPGGEWGAPIEVPHPWVYQVKDLVPGAGQDIKLLEYKFEATSGPTVKGRGHGQFTISSAGQVVVTSSAEDRKPLEPITFTLARPNAPKLRLSYAPLTDPTNRTEVLLDGVWDPVKKETRYVWQKPLDGRPPEPTDRFVYSLAALGNQGQALLDEVGDPVVLDGEMSFNTYADTIATRFPLSQYAYSLNKSAQVVFTQQHNAFGEVISESDQRVRERADAMVAQYNSIRELGGQQFVVNPSALQTESVYNNLGRLIRKTEAETFVTGEDGRVARQRPITEYGYDLVGRLTVSTDANGKVGRQAFAGSGERLSRRWAGDGGLQQTEYDRLGDAVKLVNEVGVATQHTFDKLGQLVKAERHVSRRQDFASNEFSGVARTTGVLTDLYGYDALGRRIWHTGTLAQSELGNTLAMQNNTDKTWYDSLGRITKTRTAGGLATTYTYQQVAKDDTGNPVLGVGGLSVGGHIKTTTFADQSSLVDEIDYFGRTTWHQDMGGRKYTYEYNLGGQLVRQSSKDAQGVDKQNINYKYLLNGYVSEVIDTGNGAGKSISSYGYDNAGNRTFEHYGHLSVSDQEDLTLQSSNIEYDELNRISRVRDNEKTHDLRYEYDAVGNRRAAIAVYWDPQTYNTLQRDDHWYTYDGANRFLTTKGSFAGDRVAGGSIQRGERGISIGYDLAGQRTKATAADGTVEEYSYSEDGYLEDTKINGLLRARRRVDAEGRTLQYLEWETGGATRQVRTTQYDRDNRLLQETVTGSTAANGATSYYYLDSKNGTSVSVTGGGVLGKTVYQGEAGGGQQTTTYSYEYWDSAKQTSIQGQANGMSGLTSLTYNANGHLMSAYDASKSRTLSYLTNAQGLVLRREEWVPEYQQSNLKKYVTSYYYATGRRVGDVSTDPEAYQYRMSYAEQLAQDISKPRDLMEKFKNFRPVTSADFDQNYEPINASYPGGASTSYTARTGDTLSSIAQSVWGDAEMWYLIAEANGLRANSALTAGQVLVIPNKVTNIHNNANTFRPYNPGEVIGHIDPTIPAPPPPPRADGGCGGLGTILMIVVAVVVTVYTAGALSTALAAPGPATAGTSGFAATMQLGGAALTGGGGLSLAGSLAVGAVAGAAGSVASQLIGMAIGNVEQFSWKAVGRSAFSGGTTAGVGNVLSSAAQIGSTLGNTAAGALIRDGGTAAAAIKAGAGSAVSLALQGQWSWREVAASTVGAAAGYAAGDAVGRALSNTGSIGRVAASTAAAVAGGWASSQVLGLSSRETRTRVGQAFISGLANGMADALADPKQGHGLWPDGDYRNGSDIQDDRWVAQRDARYGFGGTGAKLGSLNGNSAANWSRQVDQGIRDTALGLQNFEVVASGVWAAQETQTALTARAVWRAENVRADAYGKELDTARTRELFNFGDGRDTRDIRMGFGYQSRLSVESSSIAAYRALATDRYQEVRPVPHSAREQATSWFSSMVGSSRAGNVLTGVLDGWLAGGEVLANLPSVASAFPSIVGRLATGTADFASRLWDNPLGTVSNTMATAADGVRGGFSRVVNGDGRALGSVLFAAGTIGIPLGRVEEAVGSVEGAMRIGVPATRSANRLSPVLEYDIYGNEIYYRAMKESHYKRLAEDGRLIGTGETSLAPLKAYSAGYDGALVRLTVKPGTSSQLQDIGIAANNPAAAEFPGMSTGTGPWNQTNARFKVEAVGVRNINDGLGIMNTQLGKGRALDIFNANLLDFERLN